MDLPAGLRAISQEPRRRLSPVRCGLPSSHSPRAPYRNLFFGGLKHLHRSSTLLRTKVQPAGPAEDPAEETGALRRQRVPQPPPPDTRCEPRLQTVRVAGGRQCLTNLRHAQIYDFLARLLQQTVRRANDQLQVLGLPGFSAAAFLAAV